MDEIRALLLPRENFAFRKRSYAFDSDCHLKNHSTSEEFCIRDHKHYTTMSNKAIILLGPVTLLLFVAIFRATFLYRHKPLLEACANIPGHEQIVLNDSILERFKNSINIQTISRQVKQTEYGELQRLINFIESSFPHIHSAPFIQRELVSNYSLIYTIKGTDLDLNPYMLTSHLDVVPAINENWSSHPFNATLKDDNHIYGRGTIDAKHLLMSMLEALEFMINKGFQPTRSFYLVFGHDEEIGGVQGAKSIAKIMEQRLKESRWSKLEYILDEGTIISTTKVPGLDGNIAFIGVVEKGYVTVKISTVGAVGHGSMPPAQTAITKLATAIAKFNSHMFPSFFGLGAEREMIETFATHATWPYKFLYANFWLLKPIFEFAFSSEPTLNSLIRTSTAVTMIEGGTKENVLPDSAFALVNHRVHFLQTIADVVEFDRKIIDDPTVRVEAVGHSREPSPIAPFGQDSSGYQLIKQSVLQVYPGAIVVPGTFMAASDSRWYTNLTDSIYKFSAIAVDLEEMKRFHGHDERISVANYENLINFFHHLILNSNVAEKKPVKREEL